MADIELVIKIPEEIRLALINNIQLSMDQQSICDSYIKHAIVNGTPLNEMLDKIRAEVKKKIVKRPWLDFKDRERDRNDAFLEVLDIIDKYKSESEK